MKMNIVPDWRTVWRHWSAQLAAAQLAFLSFVQLFPGWAREAWSMLPTDLRSRVPDRMAMAIVTVLTLATLFAKFVAQKPKEPKGGDDAAS